MGCLIQYDPDSSSLQLNQYIGEHVYNGVV